MKEKIYKGSTKTLYQSDEDYALIMSFDDTFKMSKDETLEGYVQRHPGNK